MIHKLIRVQAELKAPKGQYNNFGRYKYRSCEDILEAVKPLCIKEGLLLTVGDEMVEVGGRVYVKATVAVGDGSNSHVVTAFAREAEDKKGMDAAQITGAASSYARKYALNGMFCIDDTKDADTMPPVDDNETLNDKEIETVKQLVKDGGVEEEKFFKFANVKKYKDIKRKHYARIVKTLKEK